MNMEKEYSNMTPEGLLEYIHELSAEVVETAERGNALLEAINLTIYHKKPIEVVG
tara:strand:+ start:3362 stop:3526 length:165 start_codon:yes stop_codon:yes gene_type:complete